MAVPETRSHDETMAIENSRSAGESRHLHLAARSNGPYAPVMQQDCSIFNGWLIGRGIDLRVNESEVRGKAGWAQEEC